MTQRRAWAQTYDGTTIDCLGSSYYAWDSSLDTVAYSAGNNGTASYAQGRRRTHEMAVIEFDTTAPGCTLEYIGCGTATYPSQLGFDVYIDGVFSATKGPPVADNTLSTFTVTLPNDGASHHVAIYNSARVFSSNTWFEMLVRRIYVGVGQTLTPRIPAAPTRRLVMVVDSIYSGFVNQEPMTTGMPGLMRAAYPGRVSWIGNGGDALTKWYVAGGNSMTTLIAMVNSLADGTVRNDLVFQFCVNDYGQAGGGTAGWTAAAWLVQLKALIDGVAAHFNHIYIPAAIINSNETANTNGDTLGAFRTSQSSAATYATQGITTGHYIDTSAGNGGPAVGDLVDGLHCGVAGVAKIFVPVRAALGI